MREWQRQAAAQKGFVMILCILIMTAFEMPSYCLLRLLRSMSSMQCSDRAGESCIWN